MKTESGINTRALVLDILLEMEKGRSMAVFFLRMYWINMITWKAVIRPLSNG